MIKKIFLSLILILGISSSTFGKEYLCEDNLRVDGLFHGNKWNTHSWSSLKYIIKTDKEGKRLTSFKRLGGDSSFCPINPEDDPYNTHKPVKQQYVKRPGDRQQVYANGVISCRSTWIEGKATIIDINFEPKRMKFHMFRVSFHSHTELVLGTCVEM